MVQRGETYYADLNDATGSEQKGIRPVLVIQNNIGNKYSPTTIVAIITSKSKRNMPTHVLLNKNTMNGLKVDSTIALEQIRTIDKTRLLGKIGQLSKEEENSVKRAIQTSLTV